MEIVKWRTSGDREASMSRRALSIDAQAVRVVPLIHAAGRRGHFWRYSHTKPVLSSCMNPVRRL